MAPKRKPFLFIGVFRDINDTIGFYQTTIYSENKEYAELDGLTLMDKANEGTSACTVGSTVIALEDIIAINEELGNKEN